MQLSLPATDCWHKIASAPRLHLKWTSLLQVVSTFGDIPFVFCRLTKQTTNHAYGSCSFTLVTIGLGSKMMICNREEPEGSLPVVRVPVYPVNAFKSGLWTVANGVFAFRVALLKIGLYLFLYYFLGKTKTQTYDAAEYMQVEVAGSHQNKVSNQETYLVGLEKLISDHANSFLAYGCCALLAIKDFGQWNMVRTGFCDHVSMSMRLEVCALLTIFPQLCNQDSDTLADITHLIHWASMSWWVLWIGTFYHRLLEDGRLDETDAWDIVSQSVFALFEQLRVIGTTALKTRRTQLMTWCWPAPMLFGWYFKHIGYLMIWYIKAWMGIIAFTLSFPCMSSEMVSNAEMDAVKTSVHAMDTKIDRLDTKVNRLPARWWTRWCCWPGLTSPIHHGVP